MSTKKKQEILDPCYICIYCGEFIEGMTPEQIKMFGKPQCCGLNMLVIERERIHIIVKSMDKLKANLEKELLRGVLE
jgi:hypothetical protein